MLKKLVKFGNSSALVLDRTILGLLDLSEGDVVKLRIEGDSLTIRKAKVQSTQEGLNVACDNLCDMTGPDSLSTRIFKEGMPSELQKIDADPAYAKKISSILPGGDNYESIKQDYAKIFEKYGKELMVFSSPEFIDQESALRLKYKDQSSLSDAYKKEIMELRKKFWPNIEQMDLEMLEVSKKYGV